MSMDMPSDRRVIRYYELLKYFEFFQSPKTEPAFTLCDAGCGFGDINGYLQKLGFQDYSYIGLDVVDEFMDEHGYAQRPSSDPVSEEKFHHR